MNDKISIHKIIKLIEAGLSMRDVASQLGISRNSVEYALRKAGIKSKCKGGRPSKVSFD